MVKFTEFSTWHVYIYGLNDFVIKSIHIFLGNNYSFAFYLENVVYTFGKQYFYLCFIKIS